MELLLVTPRRQRISFKPEAIARFLPGLSEPFSKIGKVMVNIRGRIDLKRDSDRLLIRQAIKALTLESKATTIRGNIS